MNRRVLAAKAATATISIVCTLGGDAVAAGLVAQLNRPDGNITGETILGQEMGPKRVELAHQLVPKGIALAALVNSKFPLALSEARDMQAAARSLFLELAVLNASTESEIERLRRPRPMVRTLHQSADLARDCRAVPSGRPGNSRTEFASAL